MAGLRRFHPISGGFQKPGSKITVRRIIGIQPMPVYPGTRVAASCI